MGSCLLRVEGSAEHTANKVGADVPGERPVLSILGVLAQMDQKIVVYQSVV